MNSELKNSYQIKIFAGDNTPVVSLIDMLETEKGKYLVYTDGKIDSNNNPIISFVKFSYGSNFKPIISTIPTDDEFNEVLLSFANKIQGLLK